ncbi:MAG: cytochrome c biosis protein [Candidatus Sumerlaeota bacterium]|nr:cytochrome c biosis protein [Candidatus Sumerlaeota bacterium]
MNAAPPSAPPSDSGAKHARRGHSSASRERSRPVTPPPAIDYGRIWYRSPWKWFFSLKVGIVLLALLTVASVVGTVIDPLERAQELVYYTWWFKLLLLALAVNMGCATTMTVMQKLLPSRPLRVHAQRAFFNSAALSGRRPFTGTAEQVASEFRRAGFAVKTQDNAGVARSGWIGRWGAPVSHVGLIVVLLAGFVASWVAREGVIQILEGDTTTTMQMRGTNEEVPLGFALTVDDFQTGFFPRTRIPSHFVSYITVATPDEVLYSGPVEVNHSPKLRGWRAHQTSYQEMDGVARHEIEVTAPQSHKPLTVEMTAGQKLALPAMPGVTLAIDNAMRWTVTRDGEVEETGSLAAAHAHGSELALVADQFEPDFVIGEDRQATSRSQELNNPALRVTLLSDGAPAARQWLFHRDDMKAFSHAENAHFSMELVDIQTVDDKPLFVVEVTDGHNGALLGRVLVGLGETAKLATQTAEEEEAPAGPGWIVRAGKRVPAYATVLTMTRNPAIPAIYFGCALMMVGLYIGFFVRRRDVWFMVDDSAGELLVAAHYRHPAEEFDRVTQAVLARVAPAAPSDNPPREKAQ